MTFHNVKAGGGGVLIHAKHADFDCFSIDQSIITLYFIIYHWTYVVSRKRTHIFGLKTYLPLQSLASKYELQNKRKTHKQDLKMVVSISGKSEMLISIAKDMLVVFAMSEWSFPFIQKQTEN